MFLGTASTSVNQSQLKRRDVMGKRTSLRHLYQEHFLTFLRFGDVGRHERVLRDTF
jgi:hypothetical protein